MFCPSCGSKISLEAAKFCSRCGFDLSKIPKSESSEASTVEDPQHKDEPPRPIPEPRSDTTLSVEPSAPAFNSKPPRKWGWGWYILAGLFFTDISKRYKDYGKFQELPFDDTASLLGLALVLLLYFWFRNRLLLKRIKTQKTRSFVSGIIAWFIVGFLIAAVADWKIRTDVKELNADMRSVVDAAKLQFKEFGGTLGELLATYTPEPLSQDDVQKNLAALEKTSLLDEAAFQKLTTLLQTLRSSIDNKSTECPELKIWNGGEYSLVADQLERIAATTDQLEKQSKTMLISFSNYNKAVMRADGSADSFKKTATSAQLECEATGRELMQLLQQMDGGKNAKLAK